MKELNWAKAPGRVRAAAVLLLAVLVVITCLSVPVERFNLDCREADGSKTDYRVTGALTARAEDRRGYVWIGTDDGGLLRVPVR